MNSVSSGKVQFLKNWNNKGKRRIQNTGKHTVNKLHKVACEILKRPDIGYTSHTWRWFAATNLADAGVSFINLKRHGQCISDSVVEYYIVNTRPLRNKHLHCNMPKGGSTQMVGQHQDISHQFCNENQHVELEDMVHLMNPNPPQENVNLEDGGLTVLGFSQIYDPAYEVSDATNDGIPILTATSTKIKTQIEAITVKETLTELSYKFFSI